MITVCYTQPMQMHEYLVLVHVLHACLDSTCSHMGLDTNSCYNNNIVSSHTTIYIIFMHTEYCACIKLSCIFSHVFVFYVNVVSIKIEWACMCT